MAQGEGIAVGSLVEGETVLSEGESSHPAGSIFLGGQLHCREVTKAW